MFNLNIKVGQEISKIYNWRNIDRILFNIHGMVYRIMFIDSNLKYIIKDIIKYINITYPNSNGTIFILSEIEKHNYMHICFSGLNKNQILKLIKLKSFI